MPKSHSDTVRAIDEIRSALKCHKRTKALSMIEDFRKTYTVDKETALEFSKFYYSLGRFEQALRILGPELSANELISSPIDLIKLQLRRAWLYAALGAYESALRLYINLKESIVDNQRIQSELGAEYYRYLGEFFLNTYQYSEAVIAYQKSILFLKKSSDQYLSTLVKICLADALEGCDRREDALVLLQELLQEKSETDSLKAIILSATGEYLLRDGKLDAAREHLDDAYTYFQDKNSNSKDLSFLRKWLGAFYFLKGDLENAQVNIAQAALFFERKPQNPASLLEVYFWQIQLNPTLLEKNPHRVLLTHPIKHPYAMLLFGCNFFNRKLEFHSWIKSQLKVDKAKTFSPFKKSILAGDCWFLSGTSCIAVDYINFHINFGSGVSKLKQNGSILVDLKAGVIFKNGNHPEILPEKRIKLLIALVGAGSVGLFTWALVDFIYGGDKSESESLIDKIDDLIKKIRLNLPIKIERRANHLTLYESNKVEFLLPFDLEFTNILSYFSIGRLQFYRRSLQEVFGIAERTANNYIQQWLKENRILKTGNGKNTIYFMK